MLIVVGGFLFFCAQTIDCCRNWEKRNDHAQEDLRRRRRRIKEGKKRVRKDTEEELGGGA